MVTPDELRSMAFFASASDRELAEICEHAADVRLQAGQWLLYEGEMPSFFVVLSGELELSKRVGGENVHVSTYDPGEFFGEVPLQLGSPAVASVRALVESRVLRLAPADFREFIIGSSELNAQVLTKLKERVSFLRNVTVGKPAREMTIVGRRYDLDCHDLRDFLARNRVPYAWLEPDDERAGALLSAHDVSSRRFPLAIMADGTVLVEPTNRQLADALQLSTTPSGVDYDLAIVGAGPAGLAAAVYGGSEGLRTILIEREAPGGQAGTSSRIENYLGFPSGVSGDELSNLALTQARRFGVEVLVARAVTGIEPGSGAHVLQLDGDEHIRARTIVVATGVSWRRLDVAGIDRLVGRGVYYGASRTEAPLVHGKDIFLVGGGNSAGQAAMFFADYAHSVTILIRGESLEKSMSAYLIEQLKTKSNVSVAPKSQVRELAGDDHLEGIVVESDGGRDHHPAHGLFIFIGAEAETDWLPEAVVRDQAGFVCTGRDVAESGVFGTGGAPPPYFLETSVPGIFAAGDVRHGSIKRVASGVGEGSMAIAFIHQYLESLTEAVH
jgi:thioredoxin reductase (NADPH)